MAEYEGLALEKDRAARAAVHQVRSGMRVALGTGTTTAYAIRALAERFPSGDGLDMVASSTASEALAQQLGLTVRPLAADDQFDVMIDGADEVTPHLTLTKGGGGALFREKLLAKLSRELWVIVDHTKLVDRVGSRAPIPIEVVPYSRAVVQAALTRRR
ncbi:MAG: ribose 5-phosphate isomerase A, partial [Thermoplasmata archaeon]|nr:ribose 5-phosphate isomerase A [Thermoplasmata archaeon]